MFFAERVYSASASGLRHAPSNFFVKFVIRIFRPCVELKVQSEQPGICVIGGRRQEDAARVARPHAIGAPMMKANILGECVRKRARFFEHRARPLFPTPVIDDQVHTLMPRQGADDLGIDPWDRFKLARPVAPQMRPSEPGRLVRFPLGGHAVALCGGREFGARCG